MRHLFISDLHLDQSRPHHIQALRDFCECKLQPGYHLYILGDLFEVWLGDDIGLTNYADVIALLKEQVDAGVKIFVQHGNRDFLLGRAFLEATGVQLLTEETVININDMPILLMHGDSLCTDDTEYLAFKKQVRSSKWQQEFLALPPAQRLRKAQDYRQQSSESTANKDAHIMDVNPAAVQEVMQKYNVHTLIHGHTHRPMVHQNDGFTRIVLGDWQGHFDYLLWPNNDTWHFLRQPI
ncbi:MAG: UDP-2,3-diacylglucosamine diphosphatase [Gammaproteobacteria bacterium]|jgi:UDP-2,3-diacylglucosamine hydrolase|nr:UDP-2,3-diacylglucosamine diphosphatase [Gammaproteobacteria bacterium]